MKKVKSGKTCWSYENSQSIKQKSSESTFKPYGGDISLGNNANEAIYISDDITREKEMRLPPIYSVYHQRHQHQSDSKTYDSDDSFNGKTSGVRGFYDSEHPDDSDFVGILIKTWLLLKKQQAIQPPQQRSNISFLRTIQLIVKV